MTLKNCEAVPRKTNSSTPKKLILQGKDFVDFFSLPLHRRNIPYYRFTFCKTFGWDLFLTVFLTVLVTATFMATRNKCARKEIEVELVFYESLVSTQCNALGIAEYSSTFLKNAMHKWQKRK
jgi:hypothetical protein